MLSDPAISLRNLTACSRPDGHGKANSHRLSGCRKYAGLVTGRDVPGNLKVTRRACFLIDLQLAWTAGSLEHPEQRHRELGDICCHHTTVALDYNSYSMSNCSTVESQSCKIQWRICEKKNNSETKQWCYNHYGNANN